MHARGSLWGARQWWSLVESSLRSGDAFDPSITFPDVDSLTRPRNPSPDGDPLALLAAAERQIAGPWYEDPRRNPLLAPHIIKRLPDIDPLSRFSS